MPRFTVTGALAHAPSTGRDVLYLAAASMPLDAPDVAKLLVEYGRRTALAGGNLYRSTRPALVSRSLLERSSIREPSVPKTRPDRQNAPPFGIPHIGDLAQALNHRIVMHHNGCFILPDQRNR